jgi:hypothetical protein
MLRFFRQIRHRLLVKNNIGRYLFYAIGEILLVVIGILIALQLDQWNEEAKEREKEAYYLNSIQASISLSQGELKRVIEDADQISSAADTLFLLLSHQRNDILNGVFLDSLLFTASDYSQVSLNDGGIREVLNTGSLNIIRNDTIRLILASWEERLHKIRKYEEESVDTARDYVQYLANFMNASRWALDSASVLIPEKKEILLNDPMLRNYLDRIAAIHNGMHRRYLEEKHLLDSLDYLIDKQLSQ